MVLPGSLPLRTSTGGDSQPNDFQNSQDPLALASHYQRQGDAGQALAVLQGVMEQGSPQVAAQAEQQMAALMGTGAFNGARMEALADQFVDQVMDPVALMAMMGAGATYRVARAGLLRGITPLARGLGITNSTGIGLTSSLGAFGIEATAFPLYTGLGSEALGREFDWSRETLGHRIQSSFLVLGGLKLFGHLGQSSLRWWQSGRVATGGLSERLLPTLVPQLSMYGGIVSGHLAEQSLGLAEGGSLSHLMLESVVTLVHFNGMGRMMGALSPSGRLQALQRGALPPPPTARQLEQLRLAYQEASAANGPRGTNRSENAGPRRSHILMMSGKENGGGSRDSTRTQGMPTEAELNEANQHLEQLKSLSDHVTGARTGSRPALSLEWADNLGWLVDHPHAARRALIARNDLSPTLLHFLAQGLGHAEFQPLVKPNIERVLIANRGEIALRVARTLTEQGVSPIVTVSESDLGQSWVTRFRELGGEVAPLRGQTAAESYLDMDQILTAIAQVEAQAVHPGYGFLSENPRFAERLKDNSIALIGPSARTMARAGDKDVAKQAFIEAGVPVVPGTRRGYRDVEGLIGELEEMRVIANGELTRPMRLKAVGGGGGRGQATVYSLEELRSRFPRLSQEAQNAFGNSSIMAEAYVPRFHHVEFQIMADRFGNVVHFGERECTLQERDQKIVEIHPAAIFERHGGLREAMADAAVRAAQAVHYAGHGTVEFMVDPVTAEFFAMEVNARIQVEHRVTELVNPGLDLIAEGLRVARGLPLGRAQDQIQPEGAAVEVRLKALAAGTIEEFSIGGTSDFTQLESEGVFVEPTYLAGDRVNTYADPMLAKILVTAPTRAAAVQRAAAVLSHTRLKGSQGFRSDLERNRGLLQTRAAREALYDNHFVAQWTERGGEDLTTAPFQESRLLNDQVGVHLQINSTQPFRPYRADALAWAMERLATRQESRQEHVFKIKGPVADLLRQDLNLFHESFSGSQPGRRVWAQMDGDGYLERLVTFENEQPRRILLSRELPRFSRDRVGVERPGSIPPAPLEQMVYDLAFPQAGWHPTLRLISAEAPGVLREHLSLSPDLAEGPGRNYSDFIHVDANSGVIQILPRTTQGLRISLSETTAESALEIRGREGDVLLRLSPSEVIRDQGERIAGLVELMRSGIPRAHRHQLRTQILETLEQMAALPDLKQVRQLGSELLGVLETEVANQLDHGGGQRIQTLVEHTRERLSALSHPAIHLAELENSLSAAENILDASGSRRPRQVQSLRQSLLAMRNRVGALSAEVQHRSEFIEYLGHTPISLASEIFDRMAETTSTAERVLLDQIMTYREIEGEMRHHEVTGYEALNERMSGVRFLDRTGQNPQARLMIRAEAQSSGENPHLDVMGDALLQLDRLRTQESGSGNNVIQILVPETAGIDFAQLERDVNAVYQGHRTMRGEANPMDLKRVTFIFAPRGEYPTYRTYRPQRNEQGEFTGQLVEDTIYRDTHPMLGRTLELHRLKNFDLQRDEELSDRQIRLDSGRHRDHPRDFRLFASGTVPRALVRRHSDGVLQGVIGLDSSLLDTATRMAGHLEGLPRRSRPSWNRIFLNVQPRLEMSETEVAQELERIVNRHRASFDGLDLEKIMVKLRVHEARAPGGTRTLLVKLHNPTRERYESVVRNVIQTPIASEGGQTRLREVLVPNRIYELYLGQRVKDMTKLPWDPADIPIRPRSDLAQRISRAWRQGRAYAYHVPYLIEDAVNGYRQSVGLDPIRSSRGRGAGFVEMDLDPRSIRHQEATGEVDYNHGELLEVRRDMGLNQAGVVVGVHTADLGFSNKVRRVVIIGDLDHPSRGALAAPETARINAALRYAEEQGLPVEWYAASYGAAILRPPAEPGVENLDATASTAREIVQRAHSRGVPINLVVMGTNIGAQSYWNALAGIIHDTGGTITMLPDSSMSLTGPAALYAAMDRNVHALDLNGKTQRMYPEGLQSLAGYERVHGPNGDAMARVESLQAAAERLMLHYYYTYTQAGRMVQRRRVDSDQANRDITISPGPSGQSVGDIIEMILSGRAPRGARETILASLRDRGSPPALSWWEDVQGVQGQSMQNGDMPQRMSTLVQEMQIGGRPTMVIAPPVGPLTPGDSQLVARALWKANGRLPVVIIGSLSGFNADPLSMQNGQLFGGASIAEAIVRHEGPITVVNMGIIVGGSFVVVSRQLNPHLRMLAVEGSRAQVIGGASAAKVVFRGEIQREAEADPRVQSLREQLAELSEAADPEQRAELEAQLEQTRREVIDQLSVRDADAYDAVHSVQRAQTVGAVDEIVSPQDLREAIIRHQEDALRQYQVDRTRNADQGLRDSMSLFLANPFAMTNVLNQSIQHLVETGGMSPEQIQRNLDRFLEIIQRYRQEHLPTHTDKPGGPEGSSTPT